MGQNSLIRAPTYLGLGSGLPVYANTLSGASTEGAGVNATAPDQEEEAQKPS